VRNVTGAQAPAMIQMIIYQTSTALPEFEASSSQYTNALQHVARTAEKTILETGFPYCSGRPDEER